MKLLKRFINWWLFTPRKTFSEKLEAGEPRPITKEELEKVAAADELYRRIRHWNEKY